MDEKAEESIEEVEPLFTCACGCKFYGWTLFGKVWKQEDNE